MERRDFFAVMGTAAALMAAAPAGARAADHSHDHDHDHAHGHAGAAHDHPPLFAALKESSARCVGTGNDCLRHCFGMLSMNDTSMVACMKSVYDLVQACTALESLAAVNSGQTRVLAKAVGEICTACEVECAKFPAIDACRSCREACLACAAECRKVAG